MKSTHNTSDLLLIEKKIFTFIPSNATWNWYLRLCNRHRGNKSNNKDCDQAVTAHGILLYG